MLKIFDSLTHPTLNKAWLNPRFTANLDTLIEDMQKNNIYKALAVGLKEVGGYNHEDFIQFLKPYPQLIPIAYCENLKGLEHIKKLGYYGIKIHPRIGNFKGDEDILFEIIKKANSLDLLVLFCGFMPLPHTFIEKIKDYKLIYLHCGGKYFINTYSQLRNKDNILLDLSYTMARFEEFHNDIIQAIKENPKKFCIGSDHPEVTMEELRNSFNSITNNLTLAEKEYIAFKNLENFI